MPWHSQSQLDLSAASQPNIGHKTSYLVNFLLQRSAKQTPFKLAELMPFVDNNKAELNKRLPQVVAILKNTYGILLNELKDGHSGKRFILTATTTPVSALELTPTQRSERTLLWIVLCYIFLRRGEVTEPKLQKFLELCNIEWVEEHPYFDNVKKLIEDTFVKDLYLKRVKQGQSGFEDLVIAYSWGERAKIEVDKKSLLSFAQSFMAIDPNLYASQINEGGENETQTNMEITD